MLADVEQVTTALGHVSVENRLEAWRAMRGGGTAVAPPSFIDFVTAVNPKYKFYPHVRRLADVLQKVSDGDITRLMVFMPPRHGKSELVSRLFSAYYLICHPDRWVGINSYAAELAYTFSRNARDNYTRFGGKLSESSTAVKHWETGQGGGLWAAGVGGPITGKGFHLGIIDDPLKNAEEAASETIREKHKDWYSSTFYTREEPEGAIVVIQTRWHEDDLSGWLLSEELEEPERWHIVHYEAIKEEDLPDYPPTCTIEPDGRKVGEALAPERYTIDKLRRIARRIGNYFFGALYQQTPKPKEGNRFKRAWFEVVPGVPGRNETITRVRYWDKAGTKDAGASTAGVLMALHRDIFYIEDVLTGQWEAHDREKIIRQTADTDNAMYGRVTTIIEQEPGSGGKESANETVKNLSGYVVIKDLPKGDKQLRAEPFAIQAGINNVKIVAGSWNKRYLDILTAFPNGSIKDPVDASSGAFAYLAPLRGNNNGIGAQPTKENKWNINNELKTARGSRWRM